MDTTIVRPWGFREINNFIDQVLDPETIYLEQEMHCRVVEDVGYCEDLMWCLVDEYTGQRYWGETPELAFRRGPYVLPDSLPPLWCY